MANLPVTLASAWPSYFYYHDGDWLNPAKNPAMTAWFAAGQGADEYLGPQGRRRPGNHGVNDTHRCTVVPWPAGGVRVHSRVRRSRSSRRSAEVPAVPGWVFRAHEPERDLALCDQSADMAGQRRPGQSFQFGISSPKADRSMTPAKYQAAWRGCSSSRRRSGTPRLSMRRDGSGLPIIKGATAPPQLAADPEPVDSLAPEVLLAQALFDSLTSSSFQDIDGLYLEYVDGYISLAKAVSEYRYRCWHRS